ncbi:MAG: IclR family transcriptional regulator [Novosphingobium sp.]|nr:IclR family transcriptional regulator [Novosphingobium sp.]
MPTATPKKRAGIQSVEIGMRVLEALAELGAARPLAAIVRGCGLSPSQTHRYLASLSEAGMVLQDVHGNYDLGPAALKLGLSALARIDVFRIADEKLAAFRSETGATVLLAALGPSGPTIVRWHMGSPPVVTSLALGSVLSLVNSATGQVFLAFRPDQEIASFVQAELERNSSIDASDIEKLKAKVRGEGRAHVGGTLIPGLDAKAFPIFDLQGNAVLTATLISLHDPRDRKDSKSAVRLRAVCRDISEVMGAPAGKI